MQRIWGLNSGGQQHLTPAPLHCQRQQWRGESARNGVGGREKAGASPPDEYVRPLSLADGGSGEGWRGSGDLVKWVRGDTPRNQIPRLRRFAWEVPAGLGSRWVGMGSEIKNARSIQIERLST